ncbi:MAG: TetR family transcriptional regulator [Rhodospirillales bacterium]|nr:TetR family transcriptional regulator [Rhodospirillales bacterium]
MDDNEFDRALVAAGFELVAERGWRRMRVVEAARRAGLPLDRARARFPCRAAVLMRFGRIADQAALGGVSSEAAAGGDGPVRDRLFDMLMRRIDVLQAHRAGMVALLRGLPADPPLALLLAAASLRSMGWLLDAAGVSAAGPLGALRAKGLLAVWLWTLRAWQRDESADLAATMAALDQALTRAGQAAAWLERGPAPAPGKDEPPEAPGGQDVMASGL